MDFNVTRSGHGLVPPSQPTPSAEVLDLSVIDRQPVLRCNARTLHVFSHASAATAAAAASPARVIRQAFAKALVPYYPLAGRLKLGSTDHTRLQIECSGEGIWMVEAKADRSLAELDYFENVMSIPGDAVDRLLPPPPPPADGLDPLVLVQITQFSCNGFVMGLTFCHAICDGLGAAQFVKAVGEMARGAEKPSITPSWNRDLIQSPSLEAYLKSIPSILSPLPPPIPPDQLEHVTLDIPLEEINRQKQKFRNQTNGQKCSAFDIVAANFWRHRTRAISDSLKENDELKLVFFANCRYHLSQPLPRGFYGNCFFPVTVTASCGMLKRASMVHVVKNIQEAKAGLASEFAKWMNGGGQDVDPFLPPPLYTTLFLSEWGRLGFKEVDYGWGPPVQVVPIQGSGVIPVGIVGSLPSSQGPGVRLMTWCVEKAHLQPLANWPTGLDD
ncbi:acyl transferase 4-like [Coffea arabica]|uniref:Acyl transferase 4-like n=1 Tax=Coffea arabica TaxID=13443 RepID=A0A6P6THE1_COFAR|nr:acyl transferase 4-like [Coffea arabica]